MPYETIIFKKESAIAFIQFNLPQTMNALESKLVEELSDATINIAHDEGVKAVVLTGSGKAFCAGGDLHRLADGFDSLGGYNYLKPFHRWIVEFTNLEKPVIAAVNGHAIGAGFCIALLCDIVFASEQARFSQAFVNVGLVPDLAGMYFLPRLVGITKAKELVFTGKTIDAREACRLGIVNEVFPGEKLIDETMVVAQSLAAGPTVAHRLSKKILSNSINLGLEELLELEAYAQALCFQTDDHKDAVQAFLEKRKPIFQGK